MRVGDWVQTTERVQETPEDHSGLLEAITLAEVGAVGHIVEVIDAAAVNVFWERTGMVTVMCVDQLKRLGSADTGKALP